MDPKKNAHPTRHAKSGTCPSTVVWQPSEKLLVESRERLLNDLYAIDMTLSHLRLRNLKSSFASASYLTPVLYPQTPVVSPSLHSRPPHAQTPPMRLNSSSSPNQKGRKEREGSSTCFVEAAINSLTAPSPIDDTMICSPEDSTHTSRRGRRGRRGIFEKE